MSEFTAVGPAEQYIGPPPRRPRHSLLEVPGVIVDDDPGRILNGVNVLGYPQECPSLWEPCLDGTFRLKNDDSTMPSARFDSFVVYQPLVCSTISFGGNPQELLEMAETVLNATVSSGVERMLAEGLDGSSNPFFGDANVDVLNSGTAVSPGVGLSFLEEAIGTTCREGLLHLTPAVVGGLQAFPLGGDSDMRLETANGTPVASGMGYQDVTTPDLSAPGDTEDWVFATGPVRVYLGPIVITEPRESLDRATNVLTFRAERYVVALWDTALQAAVLVDWAT